ncbi:MAG: hypothetical protein LBM78_04730, partial [Clostridiales bacterium]|nr:hypothetical protein [Clostridiales bacterium]
RANGLNRLLYRCPKCGAEHETEGKGSTLTCLRCGKAWEMQTDGSLKATDGETEFSHIPDWYDWQQEAVRAEIEAGDYRFSDEVYVRTLPGANRFYNHGKGTLEHTADGRFILKCKAYGKDTEVEWSPVTLDGLHIEYNYKKVGDCVDLSVEDESYWLYPVTKKDALTKLSIATDIFHAKAVGQAWQK